MPLNSDPLLLDKDSFTLIRDISANMDAVRVEPYIREAQVKELREFMGESFYLKMIEDYNEGTDDFTTARFEELWFGTTYTVQSESIKFYGLFMQTVYFAYARILTNNQLNVTRYGVKHMEQEFSEDEVVQQVRSKERAAMSQAILYQSDAEKFLQQNQSTYPEWRDSTYYQNNYNYLDGSKNNSPSQSFKFWKI